MKKIEKYFQNVNIKNFKGSLNEEYYLLKTESHHLYIKSEFFVLTIFTHGSKWVENLFKDIYGTDPEINDIVNKIEKFEGLAVDIEYNNSNFENAVLIPHQKEFIKKDNNSQETTVPLVKENINLNNVRIRIIKKKVPLDFIENIGSGTQFLISDGEKIEVELIQDEKIVGKGILEKIGNGFNLEITEVLI